MVVFLYLGFQTWLIELYKTRISRLVLRHLVYPYAYQRFRFLGPITRLRALLLGSYCSATLFCNAYRVHDADEASVRAGWLSIFNTIPLLLSGRIAMASRVFGMSLNSVLVAHATTGIMAAGQALAHVVLELRKSRLHLDDSVQLYGFMVRISSMPILVAHSRLFRLPSR
jgi:hypothetical protein